MDEIDYRILRCLQSKNSCSPKINYIADVLGMAPSSTYSRIKKLEQNGIIADYIADVDAKKLNKPLTVFALVKLDYPKTAEEIEFNETVADRIALVGPQIQEIHSMTGDWELLIKMKVKDSDEYYSLVKEIVKSSKIINKITALFALKTHREHHIVYP